MRELPSATVMAMAVACLALRNRLTGHQPNSWLVARKVAWRKAGPV